MLPNYNPYYPMDYQSQLNQQYQQLQNMQQSQQRTVVDFVQGEASADVFPVNNGQKVILFDIDSPYVYQKERDLSGKLEKHRFRLILDDEKIEEEKQLDLTQFVKTEDISQIVAEAVEKKMSEYTLKPTKKKVVAEEE